jgi:hypothetical protein
LNCYFWQDETHKNDILAAVAHLVLPDVGLANSNHVSVFGTLHFKRKMVPVFFCDGAHLGQINFVHYRILL